MFPVVGTLGHMSKGTSKSIQVIPKPETSTKIDTLKKLLGVSRAGFCESAIEFVLPKIESGEMALINGKLQFVKQKAA